jgi:hypothetical protein
VSYGAAPFGALPFGAAPAAGGSGTNAVTATGVDTGAPTVGTPSVGQVHALTATGVDTGAPTVGSPAAGQAHALTATGVATGAPTVGTPAVGQVHVLVATGIATGAPTVGSPSLSGGTDAVEPTGIATGAPTVGAPAAADTDPSETVQITARIRFASRPISRQFRLLAGSSVDVTLEFLDEDGVAVEVTGASLSATRPDGAAHDWTEGAFAQISTGVYRRTLTPPAGQVGNWIVQGACTGPQPETAVGLLLLVSAVTTSAERSEPDSPIWLRQALQASSDAQGYAEAAAESATLLGGGYEVAGSVLGVTPGGAEPTVDDTSALNAQMADFATRGGGEFVLWRSHNILGPLIVPDGVYLRRRLPPLSRRFDGTSDQLRKAPALFMGPSATIKAPHGLQNMMLISSAYQPIPEAEDPSPFDPVAMEWALDVPLAMESAGDAITIENISGGGIRAEEIEFRGISAFGFNRGIYASGGTRHLFDRVITDCIYGMDLSSAGGTPAAQDITCRAMLINNIAGVTSLACDVLAVGQSGSRMMITIGPPRTPPTLESWAALSAEAKYVPIGEKCYTATGLYRSATAGNVGGTEPTHTSGRESDGGVVWAYKGEFTAGQLAPADAIPKSTGGFLKAGHPVFLTIDPRDAYTGNSSYPHWSVSGAPSSVASLGGDLIDPAGRGRCIVYGFGTITSTYAEIVLAIPYHANLAAAWAGCEMHIIPGFRPGAGIKTDNVDGLKVTRYLGKGPGIDIWSNSSALELVQISSEQPAAGEEDVTSLNSITVVADEQSDKLIWQGGLSKSKGTGFRSRTKGSEDHQISGVVFQGLQLRAIDMEDGQALVHATFNGNAPLHSRTGAGHLKVHWSGDLPPVTGEGSTYEERVSRFGWPAAPNRKKRALVISAGSGVDIGYGQDADRHELGETYTGSAVVWNTLITDGTPYLYRCSVGGTAASTGNGPQHTSGSATDGTATWVALGPYTAAVALLRANQSTGRGQLRAAATGADAPDVLGAEASPTNGRGLLMARGAEWGGATSVNPAENKGLTGAWLNNTTWRWRMRNADGSVVTFDMGPFA